MSLGRSFYYSVLFLRLSSISALAWRTCCFVSFRCVHQMIVLCVNTCRFVASFDIDSYRCLWQECVNLTELYLSHNHISVMEGLSTLRNLRVLDLASNKISALSNLDELSRYLNYFGETLKCTTLVVIRYTYIPEACEANSLCFFWPLTWSCRRHIRYGINDGRCYLVKKCLLRYSVYTRCAFFRL